MYVSSVNPATSSRRYTEHQKRYSKRREMMKLKVDQTKKVTCMVLVTCPP